MVARSLNSGLGGWVVCGLVFLSMGDKLESSGKREPQLGTSSRQRQGCSTLPGFMTQPTVDGAGPREAWAVKESRLSNPG